MKQGVKIILHFFLVRFKNAVYQKNIVFLLNITTIHMCRYIMCTFYFSEYTRIKASKLLYKCTPLTGVTAQSVWIII